MGNRFTAAKLLRYIHAKSVETPKPPAGPTNLVLEQLRLIRTEASSFRAEMNARFNQVDAHCDKIEADVANINRDIRGLKLNTIAEIYKANLTVASFVDLERRVQALEQKASS